MKNVLVAFVLGSLLVFAGCSKENSDDPMSPALFAAIPTVTFNMQVDPGSEGRMRFVISPSVDVRLDRVIVALIPPPNHWDDTQWDYLTEEDLSETFVHPSGREVAKGARIWYGEYVVDVGQVWGLIIIGAEAATLKPFRMELYHEVR